jgi:hypothetical protein
MHQIVLLTALSATTGLFGGGRQCSGGGCGMPMMYQPVYASPYAYGGCQGGMGCGGAQFAYPQAPAYAAPQAAPQAAPAPASKAAPQAAPAPAPPAAPAPAAAVVPQGFHPAHVFTTAPTWGGGFFYRR